MSNFIDDPTDGQLSENGEFVFVDPPGVWKSVDDDYDHRELAAANEALGWQMREVTSAVDGPTVKHYIVQPGDTLSAIARRHGTTVKDMRNLNIGIADLDLIFPGQLIHVLVI